MLLASCFSLLEYGCITGEDLGGVGALISSCLIPSFHRNKTLLAHFCVWSRPPTYLCSLSAVTSYIPTYTTPLHRYCLLKKAQSSPHEKVKVSKGVRTIVTEQSGGLYGVNHVEDRVDRRK
jgi:hypothetical protein